MSFILYLKSFFAQPTFSAGERVNLIVAGAVSLTDGYVVGQNDGGVLVEWPRGGSSVVRASQLCVIG
jgi:hypothetical protein